MSNQTPKPRRPRESLDLAPYLASYFDSFADTSPNVQSTFQAVFDRKAARGYTSVCFADFAYTGWNPTALTRVFEQLGQAVNAEVCTDYHHRTPNVEAACFLVRLPAGQVAYPGGFRSRPCMTCGADIADNPYITWHSTLVWWGDNLDSTEPEPAHHAECWRDHPACALERLEAVHALATAPLTAAASTSPRFTSGVASALGRVQVIIEGRKP
jgi:hypothetical protein